MLPVGVATQIPSARMEVMCFSSMKSSVLDIAGLVLLVAVRIFGWGGKGEGEGKEGDIIITWIRATIDNDVVEDRIGSIGSVCQVILRLIANQLFNEIALFILLRRLRPHDGGFEPQSQADRDAVFEGCTQGLLVVGVIEFCEEA